MLQQPPAGIHFLLFITTLQRGGTCAAHGIVPKIAILAYKTLGRSPPLNDLKLNVLKNGVLKGSGLDFGGPGPRFWRLGASNWKPPGLDFGDFVAFKNVCLKCMVVPQHSYPKFNPAPANLKCMPVLHPSCPKLGRRRWYPQRGVFNKKLWANTNL